LLLAVAFNVGCSNERGKNATVAYYKSADEAITNYLNKENGEYIDKEVHNGTTFVFYKVDKRLGVFSVVSSGNGYYAYRGEPYYQFNYDDTYVSYNVATGDNKYYKMIAGSVSDPKKSTVTLYVRGASIETKSINPNRLFYYFLVDDPQIKDYEIRIESK
jgi:hypothetical protein